MPTRRHLEHRVSVSPEGLMAIRVLLADSSDVMRSAILKALKEEPLIQVVGQSTNFAETLELNAELKPDVLLLDPHMHDEREFPPELVKARLLPHAKCVIGISFWNDADVTAFAETYGAVTLLDKTNLYSELIPAIKQFCPTVSVSKILKPFRRKLESSPIVKETLDAA
jgi:chemotaxis response regulator CheB